MKEASLNTFPRLKFVLIKPLWCLIWQVSQRTIKLSGEFPPVFLDSIWCTFRILSFDLPLQCWQVWLSLNNTYSLTFQKSICSPCWYSTPLISGFFIFWMSKLAVSTMVFVIGRILFTNCTILKCPAILCSIDLPAGRQAEQANPFSFSKLCSEILPFCILVDFFLCAYSVFLSKSSQLCRFEVLAQQITTLCLLL